MKFIIGFVLGCIFTFLVCGITLLIRDEKETKKRRQRMNKAGTPWSRKIREKPDLPITPSSEVDLLINGYDGDDRDELIEKHFNEKEANK